MTTLDRSTVTLAVIAKEPVPGRVKTRLCPPCTPEQAADIALASLRDTFDAVDAAALRTAAGSAARASAEWSEAVQPVVVLDGTPGEWIPDGFRVIAQRGDGLDERLAAAVSDVDGPVAIIGMDTPQVTAALIGQVVDALCADGTDAVLGMADDGGYWVIALRERRPDALLGVPMSTDTTGAAQLQRLTELGLRTTLVAPLCDVDTFDEAVAVSELVPGSRFARAVASVLAPAVAPESSREPSSTQGATHSRSVGTGAEPRG